MCAGIVAALVLPTAVGAQKVKEVEVTNLPEVQAVEVGRFQLVGFTVPDYTGDLDGPFGAAEKCQDEFAEFGGIRMCTTLEIFGTVDIPAGLVGTAWARPIVAGSGSVDISGGTSNSCNFWTRSDSGIRGLAVTAEGAPARPNETLPIFDVMRSIACCTLVP